MFKKLLLAIILSILALSAALAQDVRHPRLEITGVNPADLPTVSVMVNVFDGGGQPIPDLTVDNFKVVGELADRARVVDVKSFSDQNVPIAVVLVVDVSSSMAGTPIESAKAAASAFINALGPDDPVAIVTFSSGVRLIQDFTTDRSTLMRIINGLGYGGQTYLFDGVMAAVQKAAGIDNPRRAIIVLSDGAQYDTAGLSKYTSSDVLQQATVNGVPIYTIGLGFGVDRHYLQDLSARTNGLFRESPTPAELDAVYAELANLLRTQYQLTLQVDVPADGTTYNLQIEADTPDGTASASGMLRAPVPVPVITLPTMTAPIDSVTDVEAKIVADDGLASVEASMDGGPGEAMQAAPYVYTIDPLTLAPGAHHLTFTATDTNGDVGTATLDFEVAALPSQVTIVPALGGEIADVQTFDLEISGQTPAVSAQFQLDQGVPVELAAPFSFTIDPFNLAPGDHDAMVTVVNEGGASTTVESTFSVPELPIRFSIEGLSAGQVLEDSITVTVNVKSSQASGATVAFALNGEPVAGENGSLTLNAVDLPPGPATLAVTVTNDAGQTTTSSLDFEVAALPPQVTIIGLESGETLEEDRQVSVETSGQTALADLSFQVDGQPQEADASTTTLKVLEIGPGTHTLTVTVTNQGGQTTQVQIEFKVAEGPSLTATALSMPTGTATVTSTSAPTLAPSSTIAPTANETATTQAQAVEMTATAGGQATGEAQTAATADAAAAATQVELNVRATATTGARETMAEATTAEENAAATATSDAQATADLLATANVLATVNAQATMNAEASATAATSEAEMTAQVTETKSAASEEATANAQATGNAQATRNAAATATAESVAQAAAVEQATTDAQATVNAQATRNAAATAESVAQAAAVEQSTTDAQATVNAQATLDAETATAVVQAEQATTDAQATENAQATQDAETATAVAQAEQATATQAGADEEATANAQATLDAETATVAAAGERATETQAAAEDQATSVAEASATAAAAEVQPSETIEATQEVTGTSNVTPTEAGTAVAQEVTEVNATPTVAEESSPAASVTPIGTLIPAQAQTTPSNQAITPIVIIIVVLVIVLLLVYFFLSRARRQQP